VAGCNFRDPGPNQSMKPTAPLRRNYSGNTDKSVKDVRRCINQLAQLTRKLQELGVVPLRRLLLAQCLPGRSRSTATACLFSSEQRLLPCNRRIKRAITACSGPSARPGFQSVNSPERLAQVFANLRAKGFDLSGVAVLEPQLSLLPVLYPNGVMRMAGFFPSVPMQVYFDLQFIGVQGQWRLVASFVDVAPPNAVVPSTEAPRAAPAVDVRPATAAAPSTDAAGPSPTQSAEPKAAPSVDVGKPKPTPRTSVGLGKSTPMPKPTTSPRS
jgi:hypothetical protein